MLEKQIYSHVSSRYGKMFYRGYENKDGKKVRVHGKIPFSPTLYLETKEDSEFKSIYGKTLKPKKFDGMPAAREFVKQYKDAMAIYGYEPSRWHYEFIAKNYPAPMQVLLSDLKCIGFDIETKVGVNGPPGVPDPYLALEEITHVAFEDHATGKMISYTTAPVTVFNHEDCPIVRFKTETELLEAIIRYIREEDPDIIYGFYSEFFDVPYIINRINNVLGEDRANDLSPFGVIDEREYEIDEEVRKEYTIVGRTHYDIQAMYKKFVPQKEEKYSLDHLAKVNMGVGKLENPCTTFKQFSESTEHVDTFAKYNVIDTKRMTQLDKSKGLLALGTMLAYTMKCCFEDVYSPVRYWECSIQSTLLNENTFVAIKRQSNGNDTIPGAFVEEPVPGFYKWLISIDATSLYPSIMKALNISPETLMGVVPGVTVDLQLQGKTLKDFGLDGDYTLAANGAYFRKDFVGIVPRLVDKVLDGRRLAKNEMLRLKQLYIDTKDENYKRTSELNSVLEKSLKVAANSFFGITLQPGYMFYDPRLGGAITLSGQYIIKKVSGHCNASFNSFFKTDDYGYVAYMDTDSCGGDSLVMVNGDHIKIEDLYNKFLEFEYCDESTRNYVKPVTESLTPSFNTKTEVIESKPIKYIMKHAVKKEMFRITDMNGNSVVVTEDHSVIVQRNGEYLDVSPRNILDSDMVVSICV